MYVEAFDLTARDLTHSTSVSGPVGFDPVTTSVKYDFLGAGLGASYALQRDTYLSLTVAASLLRFSTEYAGVGSGTNTSDLGPAAAVPMARRTRARTKRT